MTGDIFQARILVVEDEHFMRMLIIHALDSVGFAAIDEAEHGEDALKAIARNPPDLVISDIEMKRMDGLELVRRIRGGKTPLARDARVVFLTGLSDIATLSSASELDVHGFLVKPVSANMLLAKIREAMQAEVNLKSAPEYEWLGQRPAGVVTGKPTPQRIHSLSTPQTTKKMPDAAAPVADHGAAQATPHSTTSRKTLAACNLRPGMILCHDVCARGVMMLKKGTQLAPGHVMILRDMRSVLDHELIEVDVPAN